MARGAAAKDDTQFSVRRCFFKQAQPTALQNLLQGVTDRLATQHGDLCCARRYHRGRGQLEKDYVLTQKVLGVGINGDVKLATSRVRRSRQYAVKTLDLVRHAKTEKRMENVASEIEIILTVDHPHIVRVVDIYETDSELHFVMEFCEGGELFDRMVQRGRYSEDDAAEASHQMLSVVAYLHKQGIIHRDLKPENFLFETKESSHLKLIDFGCSRRMGSAHVSGPCGTLAYTAPEVLRRNCTSQSDIWSLGVIVFMLLSGYAPFENDNKVQQTADITLGRYTWRNSYWKDVSPEGVEFVKSLMCFNPLQRFTALSALQHRWISARFQMPTPSSGLHVSVVQGLCQFQAASRLRKACLLTLARSLTHGDIDDELRNYFLQLDPSHSGMIEMKHLVEVVSASKDGPTDDLQKALNQLPGRFIDYSSFLAAMSPGLLQPKEESGLLMRDAFRHFDHDSVVVASGKHFSLQDFSEIVQEPALGIESPASSTTSSPLMQPKKLSVEKTKKWWKRMWAELTEHLDRPNLVVGASAYPETPLVMMKSALLH